MMPRYYQIAIEALWDEDMICVPLDIMQENKISAGAIGVFTILCRLKGKATGREIVTYAKNNPQKVYKYLGELCELGLIFEVY